MTSSHKNTWVIINRNKDIMQGNEEKKKISIY